MAPSNPYTCGLLTPCARRPRLGHVEMTKKEMHDDRYYSRLGDLITKRLKHEIYDMFEGAITW